MIRHITVAQIHSFLTALYIIFELNFNKRKLTSLEAHAAGTYIHILSPSPVINNADIKLSIMPNINVTPLLKRRAKNRCNTYKNTFVAIKTKAAIK